MEDRFHLGILYTSDVHSHIYPYRYADLQPMPVGLGRVATCIKAQRERFDAALVLDNGDVIQGAPNSYFDARIQTAPVYPSILALNQIGYEAAVIGNHEFNYGLPYLNGAVGVSQFPWLSANLLNDAGKPYFGQPYLIRVFTNNLRVAVLGLTTQYIPHWENPRHIAGIHFADPVTTAKKWVPWLRAHERADVIVLAYHGGIERDLDSGAPLEALTGEDQGFQLLQEVPDIDVLLTGHQHREIIAKHGKTVVVQPGHEGRHVGVVHFDCVRTSGSWRVDSHAELIETRAFEADTSVLELPGVRTSEDATQAWLDQPIGTVTGDLTVHSPAWARQADHPFVEFINRVQMWASGASISAAAVFDEDSKGFPKSVTVREIISNYKYPNTLRVLRVSGDAMRQALEKSASYFTLDEVGNVIVSEAFLYPKPQHFNYDMWEGIEYTLDISRPVGERVIRLQRNGQDIQPSASYEVVLNNYRAAGGGNYDMFVGCEIVKDIQVDVTELIANYFREHQSVLASCNGNWHIVQLVDRVPADRISMKT